jgi:flagellar hook protein FlgE
MGISQSLFTGVTGLSTNSDGMAVVANNLANANSKGFKYDRAEFEDLLSQDLGNNSQLGRGARLKNVKTMFTQGGLAVTDSLTDLAIQGQGFFIVNNPKSEKQEAGGNFYTRSGSFNFDAEGYLSDSMGGHLMGYLADANGQLGTRLQEVRVVTNNVPPSATKNVTFNVNLDSREKVLPGEFDLNNAEKSSNFSTTVQIHDSQGRAHQTTVYFKRIEDSAGISWDWHATVDPRELAESPGTKVGQYASGKLKFDSLGNLREQITNESNVNFKDGALPNQVINFSFGKPMDEDSVTGPDAAASVSVAARSATVLHYQDGYEAGNLKTLKIELDGAIRGFYTNGIQRRLGSLALASFENENGLEKAGRNNFMSTHVSGPPKIGQPQSGTRGSIYSGSLEESNVDLATQFVNMIMTQRNFQANSRSVTTADAMIEEIINMKR